MVDAVDSFLNNAQSTFTFKQLTITEFRQVRFRLRSVSEFDKLSWNPETSDRCRRIPPSLDWPESGQNGWISGYLAGSGHLAGILDRSGRLAGILAGEAGSGRLAGILAGEAGSGQNAGSPARTAGPPPSGRIRLFWPNLRPTGRKLAKTADFRSTDRDPAVLCRIPATLPEFVYAKF